jgi:adenylate kinase
MLIALTGTPGVGKTEASKLLHENGFNIINEKDLILELDITREYDEEKDELIVDPADLRDGFKCIPKRSDVDTIFEGHLSYLAESDITIVLRLDPEVLVKRLSSRGYDDQKIKDNVETEALSYVLIKSVENEREDDEDGWKGLIPGSGVVFEIDTTGFTPEEVADKILKIIDACRNKELKTLSHYRPGRVDWLEAYLKWC